VAKINIIDISDQVKLLDLGPQIPGYGKFICSYLVKTPIRALIDPGPSVTLPELVSAMRAAGLKPEEVKYIILTHIHIDHAGCTGALIDYLPEATVIAHPRARRHLIDPTVLWQSSLKTLGDLALIYGEIRPVPSDLIIEARDNMKIDLGDGYELVVFLTPGHAPHHLSLYKPDEYLLFAGEAGGVCINGSLRLATPPPFKMRETLSSIDKLIALKPEKICYGHFGCYPDATRRLEKMKSKIINWHHVVNEEHSKGRDIDQILQTLYRQDEDLRYLDNLDKDSHAREIGLMTNTIQGLLSSLDTDVAFP